MRPIALLGLGWVLCACAAGGGEPDETAGAGGGAGTTATGGSGFGVGGSGAGPACDRYVLQGYEPGPDGIVGTADDVLGAARSVQIVDPTGNFVTRETYYSGPGPDGAWDTDDDVVVAELRVVPAASGGYHWVSYDGPGPNAQWGDADDHVDAATFARLDASGRPIETRAFNGPGADGTWMTDDDMTYRLHTFGYGDGQTLPKLVDTECLEPGQDGVWATADDPPAGVTRRFDAWGTFAMDPGPDGVWANDDDVLSGRYEDKRDFEGHLQWLAVFNPGNDGAYFTPDDAIGSLAVSSCVGDAIDVRLIAGAGPDASWDTPDDLVQAHMRISGCPDICGAPLPASPTEPK